MVRTNLTRFLKHCAIVFLLTALMQSAFAQEQHGVVFDITTTSTSYSTANNSYDATSTSSGVYLRFEAPFDGSFRLRINVSSSDYYLDECTDDTFSSCSRVGNIYSQIWTRTLSAQKGESFYYKMTDYGSKSPTQTFAVNYDRPYIVSFNGKDTSVFSGSYANINASSLLSPTKALSNWKIISGTGTFGDSTSISTYFYPTSDAELGIDTKTVSVYALTDKFKSYTYNGIIL